MYHIIVNPASRSGKGLKIWTEQVEPLLKREAVSYQCYFSSKAGDATEIAASILASEAGDSVHMIVLGGDGTMNEVVSGISEPSRVVLGYLPTGSSNDFARDLGLPKKTDEALNVILHTGTRTLMDLGTVTYDDGTSRRFCVSCGIGYDAAVCEEILHSKAKKILNKIGLGKLTYLAIALKQLLAARAVSAKITLDGGEPVNIGRMLFTACMLHRFEGGGFMFAPDADATDGILNLCKAGDLSKLLILRALPTAFKGKHYRFNGIDAYQAKEVVIEASSPLWVHTDGEVARNASRIRVSCEKQCIRIITPVN